MFYFIVRVGVNMIALWLTLHMWPGLHVDLASEIRQVPELTGTTQLFVILFVEFIYYFILALLFAFAKWFTWPIILALTGHFVVWSFGLFLVVLYGFMFYRITLMVSGPQIVADDPVWFWSVVGGITFAAWVFLLEGVTGLDSPLKDRSRKGRRYWRFLRRLTFGGRNYFAENLRIAQSLDIVACYTKDILFDSIPVVGSIRRFFQHVIYWRHKPLISESTPETVRYMLQELGPTFVKLGQIISSRSEQLPPAWRTQFAMLQSNVEPFPAAEAEIIITRELGRPPQEIYTSFEAKPLAAASTAQVHRATLPDGAAVVVKVQRPDIDLTVRADLNVIKDLMRLTEQRFAWARHADLSAITNEYADNILLELDYTNEAFNGRLLAQNMAGFSCVHVPRVYTDLSTQRVMTQEFVKGVKITNVKAIDEAGLDRTALAITFTQAIVKQLLFDGFFHGDPHPGNVLVNTETGTIIFLDMGMMGALDTEKRLILADLIWSLKDRDSREIAKVILRLTTSYKEEVDAEAFIQDVERLMRRYTTFSDGNLSISNAMRAMFDALARAGLRMDSDLTLALKALTQAEETVRTLDPDLPLVETAYEATKMLMRETFDVNRVIDALRLQAIRGAKDMIRNIPSIEEAVISWIQQFRNGRLTLEIDTSDLTKQLREINATTTTNIRHLIYALLLVGLLIGGGVASTTQGNLLPNLPDTAYLIFVAAAMCAGAVLVRAIWNWLNRGNL